MLRASALENIASFSKLGIVLVCYYDLMPFNYLFIICLSKFKSLSKITLWGFGVLGFDNLV